MDHVIRLETIGREQLTLSEKTDGTFAVRWNDDIELYEFTNADKAHAFYDAFEKAMRILMEDETA